MRAWSIWRWIGLMALGFVLTTSAFFLSGGSERHEPRYASDLDRDLCALQARQQATSHEPAPPSGRQSRGRQPDNCDPPALLHLYIGGVVGTLFFGIGLGGTVIRGFQSGGPGRTSLGQFGFGLGAVGLAVLLTIPVLEEAERAICLIMCPPRQDDAFTAIFVGYFFLAASLVPIGLLLMAVGTLRWAVNQRDGVTT